MKIDRSSHYFINNYEYKYAHQKLWLLLLFQNLEVDRIGFLDESEALSCKSDTKYSILGELQSNMKLKTQDKFEFLMEYPEYDNNYYYQWKQDNNPLNESEEEGKESAFGFVEIHRPNVKTSCNFTGLVRTVNDLSSTNRMALLNGQTGVIGLGGWHYAVALYNGSFYKNHADPNKSYAFNIPIANGKGANAVFLWVRVPYTIFHSYFQNNEHHFSFFAIILGSMLLKK